MIISPQTILVCYRWTVEPWEHLRYRPMSRDFGDRWRPCVFPLRILQLAATFAVHHMWEAYNANPCRPPAKFEGKKDRRLGI